MLACGHSGDATDVVRSAAPALVCARTQTQRKHTVTRRSTSAEYKRLAMDNGFGRSIVTALHHYRGQQLGMKVGGAISLMLRTAGMMNACDDERASPPGGLSVERGVFQLGGAFLQVQIECTRAIAELIGPRYAMDVPAAREFLE
eukprot:COSAG01_NODE_11799_length_1857_cov_1.616610_2_plen_145_part_00